MSDQFLGTRTQVDQQQLILPALLNHVRHLEAVGGRGGGARDGTASGRARAAATASADAAPGPTDAATPPTDATASTSAARAAAGGVDRLGLLRGRCRLGLTTGDLLPQVDDKAYRAGRFELPFRRRLGRLLDAHRAGSGWRGQHHCVRGRCSPCALAQQRHLEARERRFHFVKLGRRHSHRAKRTGTGAGRRCLPETARRICSLGGTWQRPLPLLLRNLQRGAQGLHLGLTRLELRLYLEQRLLQWPARLRHRHDRRRLLRGGVPVLAFSSSVREQRHAGRDRGGARPALLRPLRQAFGCLLGDDSRRARADERRCGAL